MVVFLTIKSACNIIMKEIYPSEPKRRVNTYNHAKELTKTAMKRFAWISICWGTIINYASAKFIKKISADVASSCAGNKFLNKVFNFESIHIIMKVFICTEHQV